MSAKIVSGNFDTRNKEEEEVVKPSVRERAQRIALREVGDAREYEQFLAQAKGEEDWDNYELWLKGRNWKWDNTYRYETPEGHQLFEVLRFQHMYLQSTKMFIPRHKEGDKFVRGVGPVRVPYNLKWMMGATVKCVYLVEGEKGVDVLMKKNLIATCVQGQNWSDGIVEWFEGFEVIIAMDNDDAGRENLEEALHWLSKVDAKVQVLTLPDLGRRKGLDDWLESHTVDELKALVDKTPYEPNLNRIKVINPVDLAGRPIPERMFLAGPLIPFPNVTLLYGDGGAGKSQIGLQLGVARAIKQPWLGLHTIAGRTLILSAEDDEDETHRRLASICLYYKCSLADLGDMRVIDLVGEDAVIGELTRNGRIVATELYHFMIREIAEFEPTLVIVDALADAFAGDENNRMQARQFISMLRRPSVRYRCAFLPIAHPSLSGITSGRGTSGSTGWNNSVRSRMYFEGVEVEGGEPDPDLKRLREPKGNYGRPGFELLTRYENGVYVPLANAGTLDRAAKAAQAENVFLAILKRLTEQGRFVGSSAGINYAPAVFAAEPEATELMVSKDHLRAAMIRLFKEKRICLETYVGDNYRKKSRIAEAAF